MFMKIIFCIILIMMIMIKMTIMMIIKYLVLKQPSLPSRSLKSLSLASSQSQLTYLANQLYSQTHRKTNRKMQKKERKISQNSLVIAAVSLGLTAMHSSFSSSPSEVVIHRTWRTGVPSKDWNLHFPLCLSGRVEIFQES